MAKIKLAYDYPEIGDVSGYLSEKLQGAGLPIVKGSRIGIAVGSRGIHKLQTIIKEIIKYLQEQDAQPLVFAAMGSHGGATSEGQLKILAGYGITESELGVPVLPSLDTVCVGFIDDEVPVHVSKLATELDGIILVNRIKPHTDFRGDYESGLMKLMTIGMGNHLGAQTIHSYGMASLAYLIPEAANIILANTPVLGGIAIVENALDRTAEVKVLTASDIPREEPKLLVLAKKLMPTLPFDDEIDVLIVEELGKNISGVGLDPNVTGRTLIRIGYDWGEAKVRRIVCLDLTSETDGNAQGVGIADVITRKLYNKIDLKKSYVNALTNRRIELVSIPIIQDSELEAIELALNCCERKITAHDAKILQIKNTLELDEMYVSVPLLNKIKHSIQYTITEYCSLTFDARGSLLNRLKRN